MSRWACGSRPGIRTCTPSAGTGGPARPGCTPSPRPPTSKEGLRGPRSVPPRGPARVPPKHPAFRRRRARLVQASEDGTMLSEQELMASGALLLIAGHETTTTLIGNATLALLRNPGELARLRAQPDLAGSAVEEFLRYDGTGPGIARQAKEDVQLSGGVVPAGAVVMAVLLSANRDPATFTDPDRLDVGRGDTRHLGFGGGLHACIGAALARMEARIAMTALLAAYPRIELAVSEPSRIVSWAIRGVTSLPVNVG